MRLMKKLTGMICAIAVMLLCSVNMTYAWQNIGQTAVNISKGAPESIDGSDKDDSEKEDSGKEEPPGSTQKPGGTASSQQPDKEHGSFSGQNGKGDTKTGDTVEYLGYVLLMLTSFAVIIVIGAILLALLLHEIEKRRK